MQQGGTPSPFDRNLGTKMAAKAADWVCQQLESQYVATGGVFKYTYNDQSSAVLLGLKGKAYDHTPLEILKAETDFKYELNFDFCTSHFLLILFCNFSIIIYVLSSFVLFVSVLFFLPFYCAAN